MTFSPTPPPVEPARTGLALLPNGTTRADVLTALHSDTVTEARTRDFDGRVALALGHLVGIARCTTDRAALDSAVTVALLCIVPDDTLAQLDAVAI